MANDVLEQIAERLQDVEYRRAYGSTNIKYDLALALVEARRGTGLTQNQLAGLMGVKQPYIGKLESGRANPSIGQVGALLAALWVRAKFKIEPLYPPNPASETLVAPEPGPSTDEDKVLNELERSGMHAGVSVFRSPFSGPYGGTTAGGV